MLDASSTEARLLLSAIKISSEDIPLDLENLRSQLPRGKPRPRSSQPLSSTGLLCEDTHLIQSLSGNRVSQGDGKDGGKKIDRCYHSEIRKGILVEETSNLTGQLQHEDLF